jgi:hypothetical protein
VEMGERFLSLLKGSLPSGLGRRAASGQGVLPGRVPEEGVRASLSQWGCSVLPSSLRFLISSSCILQQVPLTERETEAARIRDISLGFGF